MNVGLYARYSQNPDDKSESTQTQIKRGRQEAEARWPGCRVLVFSDDNYSGTLDEDQRPGYAEMMASVRRGGVHVVLAKNQSRIARDTQIWDKFRVACLSAGIEELSTWTEGEVSHVAGKSLPGRIMALFDAEYVEKTRLNVLDHLKIYALEGRPPGGTCLGYTREMVEVEINGTKKPLKTLVPDPYWMPIIQQAFQDVLAGVPMATVAKSWDAAELPTPRGGAHWRPSNLRRLLISPTLTGLRVHVTEAKRRHLRTQGIHYVSLKVAKEHGSITEGLWEPIVERDTFEKVQRLLDNPSTVTTADGRKLRRGIKRGAPGKYQLSGKATCSLCRATLVGNKRTDKKSLYICTPANEGCGKLGITMEYADQEAVAQFLDFLEDNDYRAALAEADPYADKRLELAEEVEGIEQRLADLDEQVLLGQVSEARFRSLAKKAEALKTELEQELASIPEPVEGVDPEAILQAWKLATPEEKRQLFALAVDYVEIFPGLGGGRFSQERVRVHMLGARPSA